MTRPMGPQVLLNRPARTARPRNRRRCRCRCCSPPPPLEHQGQPTSLSHEQFRAALQMVVSAGDPR